MEKLYITINYTQQVGDKPIWNNGDVVEINVENKDLYLPFVVTDAQRVENYKSDKERYIATCKKSIEDLCDTQQEQADLIITGKSISPQQEQRWRTMAVHGANVTGKNGTAIQMQVDLLTGTQYEQTADDIIATSSALLQPLADMAGQSLTDFATYIVEQKFNWQKNFDSFYMLVEEFKNFAYSVLAVDDYGDFDRFWEMMDDASRIGYSEEELTPEEMIQLIRDQLDALKGEYS